MPDQQTISADGAERILRLEEGHYLDVKRIEIKPGKLSESISAFANASGGEIFVGVAEDGARVRRWAGFPDMEAANAHIQVIDTMATLGNHYSARFLQCPDQSGQILHLTVLKTRDILKATDGFPYVRRNALNVRISNDDALQRLRLDKGIATFEDETVNVPTEAITNSIVTLEFLINVVPSAEPEDWLCSQFLIVDGKPTVLGCSSFAMSPKRRSRSVLPSKSTGTSQKRSRGRARRWQVIQ
jgi:ATP-dependent DNA helicase RecG